MSMANYDDFEVQEWQEMAERRLQRIDTLEHTLTAVRADAERLAEALKDITHVAGFAMREANNDGAEYDIDLELAEARDALAAHEKTLPK